MAEETQPVEQPTEQPVAAEPQAQPAPQPDPLEEIRQGYQRLERMVTNLAGQLTRQPAAAAEPKTPQELSDEELWGLAQQGNRQAFELYQGRIADRRVVQRLQQQNYEATVSNQLAALYQKYPELTDPNHALTQRAIQFKNVLMQLGAPNSRQTDLDAILRAVADSREVLAPRASPSRPSPASGHMGASHRSEEQPKEKAPAVNPQEAALAKKMGIKDPSGSLKRFQQRQDEGKSSVSPTIAAAVREA